MKKDVVIIGAGLTGLTAAFYLQKAGKSVAVIEKADRVGGLIDTKYENGFTYECGPNAGVMVNEQTWQLLEDICDEECQLEFANKPSAKKRYVAKNGRWHALPLSPLQLIKTPLFQFKDKMGLLCEPFRKKGQNPDESLAEFVERRLGKSILHYAVDPFILGIYAGDPAKLSVKYGFSKLYEIEQQYGSLIGGMIKKKRQKGQGTKIPHRGESFSFKGGMVKMVEALQRKTGTENIFLESENTEVKYRGENNFLVDFSSNSQAFSIESNEVIVASGGSSLEKILPFLEGNEQKSLQNCHSSSVIEVTLGFKKWQGMELDGFGGLCPHRENHDILGVLFTSALMSDRAPEGGATLAVFLGGVRRDELLKKSDAEIYEILAKEFPKLMRTDGFSPDLFKIHRYDQIIPQYGVESKERFAMADKLEKEYAGLHLGIDSLGGIGLSKRIALARKITHSIGGQTHLC